MVVVMMMSPLALFVVLVAIRCGVVILPSYHWRVVGLRGEREEGW